MGNPGQRGSQVQFRVAKALSIALALVLVAAPATAGPLTIRLEVAGSDRGVDWRDQNPWGAPRTRGKSKDVVVTSSESGRGPASLIVIGAGVLAGGVGAFFGLRNHSAKSDYAAATTAAARADARDRAQSAGIKADIAFVASAVLVLGGLGLLFFTDV
jgi:hypothetical protein